MNKPSRFWMTGGVAMILAALGGRAVAAKDDRLLLASFSPYGVAETVLRIEACAQQRGLHVLARVPQQRNDEAGADQPRQVIVLESSQGGTPVLMGSAHARPDLLLSVVVQRGANGATEVLLPENALFDLPEGVSAEVQHDLAGLPEVVAQAVSA